MPAQLVKVIQIPKYNDIWFDNGLVNYYLILKSINDDYGNIIDLHLYPDQLEYSIINMEYFNELLANRIVDLRKDQMIVMEEDKKTQVKKEVKKDHILIQEEEKIGGKVKFKEQIFDTDINKIQALIKEVFQNLGEGNNKCLLCGNSYKTRTKKMQQASYPFVTKIRSLSGIRSGKPIKLKEYIKDYCPHCYLLGILEWLDNSMVYRTIPGEKSFIILPMLDRVDNLLQVKKEIKESQILNNQKRWANIKIHPEKDDVENTPGKYTTMISFYEKFIYKTRNKNNIDWFVIQIPQGIVKNPRFTNIKFDNEMINVLYELIVNQDILLYDELVKEFYAFNNDIKHGLRDFDLEKSLHEQLCEAIVFDDFQLFAKTFLPHRGIHVGLSKDAYKIMEKIILIWRINKMNVEDTGKYLSNIRMAGVTLANLIGNRLSLFFKLEKAKNLTEFLESIQEITRRFTIEKDKFAISKEEYDEGKGKKLRVFPSSIDYLISELNINANENFFNNTKSALLIYTSLNAFRKIKIEQEENNEQSN